MKEPKFSKKNVAVSVSAAGDCHKTNDYFRCLHFKKLLRKHLGYIYTMKLMQ